MKAVFLSMLGVVLAAGVARADVKVTYLEPERFTDAGLHGDTGKRSRTATMDVLTKHFEKLGARYLAPGQTLNIEVEDIDLAGRYEPWRHQTHDIRFMTDITWPRIDVRYTLMENGTAVISGKETVRDMNYLMKLDRRSSNETLHHDKVMLDEWFKDRFVERKAPRT